MMNYRKRLSISLLLVLGMVLSVSAAPRTKAAIKAAAEQVFSQSPTLRMTRAHKDDLKPLLKNSAYTVMGYKKGGFVIVGNDDLVPAVIAYSNSTFDKNTKNEGFKWYLAAAEEAINGIVKSGVPCKVVVPDKNKYAAQVPALVTSRWGQEKPYNDLCPQATSSGTGSWQGYGGTGRAVTGCVATAMAQIMYYNGYPQSGTGTHSVNVKQADGSMKKVTVNYDESVYDWGNMIDSYKGKYTTAQGNAVAKLMLDCGVAADMMYATDGSGTYTENACEGLKRNLGYPETTQMLRRSSYKEERWMDIIFNELNERRAIFYTGVDRGNGGHAFVLCGYDATGKVWINWGWEGSSDGFYDISLLNPGSFKFSEGQDMIIGFEGIRGELVEDTVNVSEPGKLASLVEDSLYERISKLKVNGPINSTDLRTIRQIAGCSMDGKMLRSSLTELDLGDAELVEGGEPYLTGGIRKLAGKKHEIPEKAFYGCRRLHRLVLPKTTTAIADGALGGMPRLESVSIPTGDDCDYVFDGKMLLTKDMTEIISVMPYNSDDFAVGKGITKIHNYGFAGCGNLTKVTLPATVASIGDEAFVGANSLGVIRIYAKSVPALGRSVFSDLNRESIKLQVPSGTKTLYKRSGQWKDFNIVEFGTTIKVRNTTRTYGSENPKLGWQMRGDYVEGLPVLTCEATPASPVGKYVISVSRGTIKEEQVEFVNGYLFVQKATANLRAKDVTVEIKQKPVFNYTVDGLQNNETTVELTEAPVFTVKDHNGKVVTSFDVPGEYTIEVSGGVAANYVFSYFPAKLTVKNSTNGISGPVSSVSVFDVYTLDGVCVAKGVTSLNGLAKGVYVVNGRKCVVR